MGNQNSHKNEKIINEIENIKELNRKVKEYLDEDKISYNYITELRKDNLRIVNRNQHFTEKSQMKFITETRTIVECSLEAFSILISGGINHEVNSTLYKATTIPKLFESNDILEYHCNMMLDWIGKIYTADAEIKYQNWEPDHNTNRTVQRDPKNNSLSKIEFSSIAKEDESELSDLSVNKDELILEKASKHKKELNKKKTNKIAKNSGNKLKRSKSRSRSLSKHSASEDEAAAARRLNMIRMRTKAKKQTRIKNVSSKPDGKNEIENPQIAKKITLDIHNNLNLNSVGLNNKNNLITNNINSIKTKEKTEFDVKTVNSILNIMNKLTIQENEKVTPDKGKIEINIPSKHKDSEEKKSNTKNFITFGESNFISKSKSKFNLQPNKEQIRIKKTEEIKKLDESDDEIKNQEGAKIYLNKSKSNNKLEINNKKREENKKLYPNYSKEKGKENLGNPKQIKKRINLKSGKGNLENYDKTLANKYRTNNRTNNFRLNLKNSPTRKYSEMEDVSKFKTRSNSHMPLKKKFSSNSRDGEEIENEQLKDFADFIMENLFGVNLQNKNEEDSNLNDLNQIKVENKKQNKFDKNKRGLANDLNNAKRINKKLRIDLRTLDSDYENQNEKEKEKEGDYIFNKSINKSPKDVKFLLAKNVNGNGANINLGYNTVNNTRKFLPEVENNLKKFNSNVSLKNNGDGKLDNLINRSQINSINYFNNQENLGTKTRSPTPPQNKNSQSIFAMKIPAENKFSSANLNRNSLMSNPNSKLLSNNNLKQNFGSANEENQQVLNFVNQNEYREILNNFGTIITNNLSVELPKFDIDLTPLDTELPYIDKLKLFKENNKFLFEMTNEEMKINEKLKSVGILNNKREEEKKA